MTEKTDLQTVVKPQAPTLRGILLWCGASNPDDEFLQQGLAKMLERYTGVSASPQPDFNLDFNYVFDALIACNEELACTCSLGSENGPCPSCQANHASTIVEKLRKQFFAAAPAQEPEIGLKEHLAHVQQFLNDLWAYSIDPLHEGMEGLKVAEVCDALLKAAKDNRDGERRAERLSVWMVSFSACRNQMPQ